MCTDLTVLFYQLPSASLSTSLSPFFPSAVPVPQKAFKTLAGDSSERQAVEKAQLYLWNAPFAMGRAQNRRQLKDDKWVLDLLLFPAWFWPQCTFMQCGDLGRFFP